MVRGIMVCISSAGRMILRSEDCFAALRREPHGRVTAKPISLPAVQLWELTSGYEFQPRVYDFVSNLRLLPCIGGCRQD